MLSPTRELATQIQSVVLALGDYMNVQCHACIGGTSIGEDIRKLEYGQHVVSGTPGRVFDMIRRRCLRTRNIKMLVLDEADELLNKGFKETELQSDTITPFGRAYYKRQADYFVLPWSLIFLINLAVACLSAAYWSISAVAAAQVLRQLSIHFHWLFDRVWYQFGIVETSHPLTSLQICQLTLRKMPDMQLNPCLICTFADACRYSAAVSSTWIRVVSRRQRLWEYEVAIR